MRHQCPLSVLPTLARPWRRAVMLGVLLTVLLAMSATPGGAVAEPRDSLPSFDDFQPRQDFIPPRSEQSPPADRAPAKPPGGQPGNPTQPNQAGQANPAAPADTAESDAAPARQRSLSRLLAEFRRARSDPRLRAELVDEVLARGDEATERLLALIQSELRPQLDGYRKQFMRQASAVARGQLGQVNLQEVLQLRQKVLALKERQGLTKQMIVAEADPAMARLREIFLVDRGKVLAASETLSATREELSATGRLWERCALDAYNRLPPGDTKPDSPPSFEDYLVGEEKLAVGLAVPMDARTRSVLAANARVARQLDPEETRAILALNLTRNLLGLNPLSTDPRLVAAARDHSKDMVRLKFFAHESPVPGKKTPWDRAKLFGTTASGENIAAGYRDGRAANEGWFHSPGHHKNMLGNHRRVGVGRAGTRYTQMFGK